MRILVLRPQSVAGRTAAALRELGHSPVEAPLFTIEQTDETPPAGAFAALVLSSANAVPALARLPEGVAAAARLFCVGDRTAAVARAAGFAAESAEGDRGDLRALVLRELPAGSRILMVAGEDRHEDLPVQLREAGHEVHVWTAYRARAVAALPEEAANGLRAGDLDAVLHYSQRGARTYLALADAAGLAAEALRPAQIVLAEQVAEPLRAAQAAAILVADRPDEASLLAVLDHVPARNPAGADATQGSAATGAAERMDRNGMDEQGSDKAGPQGRRTKSGRTPPTIELSAETVAAQAEATMAPAGETGEAAAMPPAPSATAETAPIEISATEPTQHGTTPESASEAPPEAEAAAAPDTALPPPPAPAREQKRTSVLPAIALAALVGGAVGAGATLLGHRVTGGGDTARIAELGQRLDALQQRSETLADRAALAAIDGKATQAAESANRAAGEARAATARLAELAKQPAPAPAQSAAPAIPGLQEKLDRTLADAAAARETAATLVGRLDLTAKRLDTVEATAKSAATPGRQALAAARLVLGDRLRAAIAAGRPFEQDVAALVAAGVPAEQINELRPLAPSGAATRATLLAQFRTHKSLFLRETAPAATSWQDRLLAVASRIVTVRPEGSSASSDPATLPLRLQDALERDDIPLAAQLWTQLPEPARRASEGFGTALRQRAVAESTLERIARDAVAALGQAG